MGKSHGENQEKEQINMKTIYIPKGETVQYEVLSADRLVVGAAFA